MLENSQGPRRFEPPKRPAPLLPQGHDVPSGQGVSDVAGILAELKAQGFESPISVEDEHHWDNSVPDIR